MRIKRDSNFTEFSLEYQENDTEKVIQLKVRRIFHPTRGEEVHLELHCGRRIQIKGRKTTRYDSKSGRLCLTPEQAKILITAIEGRPVI